jgi:bleomycin hydrolase
MKTAVIFFLMLSYILAQTPAKYEKKYIWTKERTILTADFSKVKKPQLDDFQKIFHFDPVRQDTTGTCWSYSGTSFIESEIYRLQKKKIKLSEMFIVYWEYVEKVKRFIRQKGDSEFGEGAEQGSVLKRIEQYGCMPLSAYSGLVNGALKHNHTPMFEEMNNYLQFIKRNNYWDEEVALSEIKAIMNKYIGTPPEQFEYEGKIYTPLEFNKQICRINRNDYVDFMSTLRYPFYKTALYNVPDNWDLDSSYHNIPLDVFYSAIKTAATHGYSIAIGGDVSEPGKYGWEDIAIIVPWDIPQNAINQSSREFRFYNKTSTDDHGIHLVGFTHKFDHDWFLIKDSGSSSHYGKYPGYYFFRDDFIKLKMLTFMIHKDAVKDILKKF